MEKIDICRRRLDELRIEGVSSLAACHKLQEELRSLKCEALSELIALRTRAGRQATQPLSPRTSLRELWEGGVEGAKELLDDVREHVEGILGDELADGVGAWSEINQEVDRRLAELSEIGHRMAKNRGGEDRPSISGAEPPRAGNDDELYATVGAAVRQGSRRGNTCSHCGRSVDLDDRFCRQCGHRLDRSG